VGKLEKSIKQAAKLGFEKESLINNLATDVKELLKNEMLSE